MQLTQDRHKAVHHHAVLHHRGEAPVDVGAAPEDHRNAVTRHRTQGQARILDRIGGHFQRQELIRLTAINRAWHDAVAQRIKACQIAEKATPRGVNAVVGVAGRIKKQLTVPIRRRIGDGIDTVKDVAPEGILVGRLGEQACHAHNRNWLVVPK